MVHVISVRAVREQAEPEKATIEGECTLSQSRAARPTNLQLVATNLQLAAAMSVHEDLEHWLALSFHRSPENMPATIPIRLILSAQ